MSKFSDAIDTLKRVIVPVNKDGYNIIIITAIIVALLSMLSNFLGFLGFIVLCFFIYFFRNPKRFTTDIESIIVAPADGVVDAIEENTTPPEELEAGDEGNWTRISTFLSVFNVHSQRIPFSGTVIKSHYREGKFVNVSLDKYSKDNERQSCLLETENGSKIAFVQIAGLIARRIVCNLSVGDKVKKGDIYGLIKFGSRVDLYIPSSIKPIVKLGQTMIGGETIIADFNNSLK